MAYIQFTVIFIGSKHTGRRLIISKFHFDVYCPQVRTSEGSLIHTFISTTDKLCIIFDDRGEKSSRSVS